MTKFILLALAASATTMSASLIPVGLIPSGGQGIGAVLTSIVFENGNNNGNPALTESGCVGILNGVEVSSAAVCPAGFVGGDNSNPQAPSVKNITYSTAQLFGAGQDFSNIVLLFNAIENDQAITLNNIALTLYSTSAGAVTFYYNDPGTSADDVAAPPIVFGTEPGQGNSGFGFQLDAAQAAIANAYAAANTGVRIGTAATASGGLSSGSESVTLSTLGGVAAVPEPGTVVMMLSGLAMVGLSARKKFRS